MNVTEICYMKSQNKEARVSCDALPRRGKVWKLWTLHPLISWQIIYHTIQTKWGMRRFGFSSTQTLPPCEIIYTVVKPRESPLITRCRYYDNDIGSGVLDQLAYPRHLYHESHNEWAEAFKNTSHKLHVTVVTLFTISELGVQKTHKMTNFWPGWIGNPAVSVWIIEVHGLDILARLYFTSRDRINRFRYLK